MITRIYVDNYRTLVNFEWEPGQLALLLGANGSGKTSVIDVIRAIREFVVEEEDLVRCFPTRSKTRWETRSEQRFELDVQLPEGLYAYQLALVRGPTSRVASESLRFRERVLVEFSEGTLRSFHDDGSGGAAVNARASRSAVGAVAPGENDTALARFVGWLDEVRVYQPDPRAMSARTDDEREGRPIDLSDFASRYPRWVSLDLQAALRMQASLAAVIPGFESLQVSKSNPKLQVKFASLDGVPAHSIDFDELSDGQRQLCVLYVLRHAVVQPGRLVVLDEPDNYLSLREIQPWLQEVVDVALAPGGPQVWFVSHHPELLNQLAPTHGTRFFRAGGPTRIEPFRGADGLNAAEVVARGWEGE